MEQTTVENNIPTHVEKKYNLKKILTISVIVLAVIVVFLFLKATVLKEDPVKVNERKIKEVVVKVERLIALPEGELPILATVSDISALVDNPFFTKAKVGDQVLLYSASQKAFLYDPIADIILEVASLNIQK